MIDEPITLESELVESEGFLQPRKVRIRYRCPSCEHEYVRTFKAAPAPGRDPPCPRPRCIADRETSDLKRQVANLHRILAEQRAPGVIGDNLRTKAVDATAEMVMRDNGVTDLKDNMREGDIAAPKLPPRMQQAADGFFGRSQSAVLGQHKDTLQKRRLEAIGRRAISGEFRQMALGPNVVLPSKKPGLVLTNDGGVLMKR